MKDDIKNTIKIGDTIHMAVLQYLSDYYMMKHKQTFNKIRKDMKNKLKDIDPSLDVDRYDLRVVLYISALEKQT